MPENNENKPTKGGKIVLIVVIVAVLIAAAVGATILIINANNTYRFVKVEDYDGKVKLKRNGKDTKITEGTMLIPDDTVTTKSEAFVELLVDTDKHVIADENTVFTINATGDEDEGKVTIKLKEGTVTCDIEHKLDKNSKFEVKTSNASFSVRGTTFTVEYDKDMEESHISVEDGTVWVSTDAGEFTVEEDEEAVITDEYYEMNGERVYAPVNEANAAGDSVAGDNGIATTDDDDSYSVNGSESELCDNIRAGIMTALMDPSVVADPSFPGISEGLYTLSELEEAGGDMFARAVCDIFGIEKMGYLNRKLAEEGYIAVYIEKTSVTVYIMDLDGEVSGQAGPHQL